MYGNVKLISAYCSVNRNINKADLEMLLETDELQPFAQAIWMLYINIGIATLQISEVNN